MKPLFFGVQAVTITTGEARELGRQTRMMIAE
jgi:hypothetical protein